MKPINQIQLFLKEIYLRFTSTSPAFFVKFRKICLAVATLCATLSASGVEFEVYGISLTKLGAVMSAVSAIIASLTVADQEKLEETLEEAKLEQK